MATTPSFGSLYLKLALQILGESRGIVVVWMVQGCEGVGDVPGVQGVQGDLYVPYCKTRLIRELRPKV